MTTGVKICGLSEPVTLEASLASGADYVGFVLFGKSPRNLTLPHAADLAQIARGRAQRVVLVVDADDALIADIAKKVRPDFLQLHGAETPARVAEIKRLSGLKIIKAVGVSVGSDIEAAKAYQGTADLILFDAKPPRAALAPGGNGRAFDWRILEGAGQRMRFMLSGGLDAGNVGHAIQVTGAPLVDVSSGVETAPGQKDATLIANFIRAAHAI